MTRTLTATMLFAALVLVGAARASWIDFQPIHSSSPDRKWQVSARFHGVTEWSNTAKTVPANGNLRYEMTDAKSNSVWVVDIRIDAGFSSFDTPAEIFVNDKGWTTVRTHHGHLLCFSPNGARTAKLDILKAILPETLGVSGDDPFYFTTAGRQWGQWYAHHYFFRFGEEEHFVVRTYWDDRLVVRMRDGKVIIPDKSLASSLLAAETEFTLSTLKTAARTPNLAEASWQAIRAVITAVHMAGRNKMEQVINLLRELERVENSCGWCSASSEYKPADGAIDPGFRSDLRLRQVVHLSLRRLGERPRVFPGVRLAAKGTEPPKWSDLPALKAPREEGETSLRPGLTPEQVVQLIGGPDFVVLDTWEYDMDTETPHTLTITWDLKGVETIVETRPAVWQQKDKRDLQILE